VTNLPSLKRVLDQALPVWITEGDCSRLDNNYWSPASFQAAERVERLVQSQMVKALTFNDIIAPGGLSTGVSPSDGGALGVLEGHNLRPNYVFPVFAKFTDKEGPDLQAGDMLLGKVN
jgi:hypothetical protein